MTREEIAGDNIMVGFPYNRIFDLEKDSEGNIFGKVENEFMHPNECGPINTSEVGRHLAILGSIALSQYYDEKNYYLAIYADVKRAHKQEETVDVFNLRAKVNSHGKRHGEAFTEILDSNNNVIYYATVKYQVLSQRVFSKLFGHFEYTGEIINEVSPYKVRRELSDVVIADRKITATYGEILPNECEGHFDNYPAIPVAIVCNLIGRLGVELFLHYNPVFSKIVATSATINAYKLAFHGEHLTIRGELRSESGVEPAIVFCEALVDGKVVADSEFEITGIKNANGNAIPSLQETIDIAQ